MARRIRRPFYLRPAAAAAGVTLSGGATVAPPAGAGAIAVAVALSGGATLAPPAGAGAIAVAVALSGGATLAPPAGAGAIAVAVGLSGGAALAPPAGAGAIVLGGAPPGIALSGGATLAGPAGLGGLDVVTVILSEIPMRTAVLDAVVAALQAAPMLLRTQAVTVARSRVDEVRPEECPLVIVLGGDQDAQPSDPMQQRYTLRVILAGYLFGADDADAEAQAAELHAYCVRALIRPDPEQPPRPLILADGQTEVWLAEGGLRIEPASVEESEVPLASFAADFTADIAVPWGNPFIAIP